MTLNKRNNGFTLVEACIGMALVLICFTAVYSGVANGFVWMKQSRDNLRANQIMVEKTEEIRLYNWNQMVYSNLVPTTFIEYYTPSNLNKGTTYHGQVNFSSAPFTNVYSTNIRCVTISLVWTNGNFVFNRNMSTLVSKNGIQNYSYNN